MKGTGMQQGWRGWMLAGGALLLGSGLAACSNDNAPDAPIENSAFDEEAPPPAEPNAEASYEPAPMIVENSAAVAPVEELPPPPPVAPDQQVLDDASATGMTSRTTRDQPPQDDAAPVDDAMSNHQGQ